MEVSKEVLASNIKRYMNLAGINQKELAQIVGVSAPTVNEWLKAKKYPRMDKIEIMANYFGILKSDLIEAQSDVEQEEYMVPIYVDDDIYDLIGKYKGLSPAQKKAIRQMVEAFLLG